MNKTEAQSLLEAYKNIVEAGAHTEDGTYAMECIEKARNSLECVIGLLMGKVVEPVSIPHKSPYQPPYVTWVGTDTFGQETTYKVVEPVSIPHKSPYQPPYVTWVGTNTAGEEATWSVPKQDEWVVG